jgi:hypothetical protein
LGIGNAHEDTLLPETVAEVVALDMRPSEAVFDRGFRATMAAMAELGSKIFIAGSAKNEGSRRTRKRLASHRVGCEGRIAHLKRDYESPWDSWRLRRLESRDLVGVALTIVEVLVLGGWQVVGSPVETAVVPPLDPFAGGQLDLLQRAPRAAATDELCLVETIHGLGQGVVIGVAAGTHGADGAGLGQAFGVADGQVLDAPVGMVNQAGEVV